MTGLSTVIRYPQGRLCRTVLHTVGLVCALLMVASTARALSPELELQALASERDMLTTELEQYKSTVNVLQPDGSPPEQSSNPAVRKLALEIVRIKESLIKVTERELTVLQEQITAARLLATATPQDTSGGSSAKGIESKPLRITARDYTQVSEQEHVERLHALLASYYAELQEAARTLPSEEELIARAAASLDAEKMARIPFNADKVRLNGAEGSTALSHITRRLTDPNIPETRRDIAPICGIRTQLFGSLIASERRSLKPVGKNNYVARVRLQPGDTTLRIKKDSWEIQIPQHLNATDFLITLYVPPTGAPELHLFAVDDLLAEDDPHIPAWLPEDFNLTSRAG
jgi:hypothetical protein